MAQTIIMGCGKCLKVTLQTSAPKNSTSVDEGLSRGSSAHKPVSENLHMNTNAKGRAGRATFRKVGIQLLNLEAWPTVFISVLGCPPFSVFCFSDPPFRP